MPGLWTARRTGTLWVSQTGLPDCTLGYPRLPLRCWWRLASWFHVPGISLTPDKKAERDVQTVDTEKEITEEKSEAKFNV